MRPKVSVCVPAYNASRTIAQTLESILAQDFEDFEVVVVNNCSDDDTYDLVRSFDDSRIRLESNGETVPITDNWNKVVRLSTAELVKIVCSDDLIAPQCLSVQVDTMRDDGVAMVASKFNIIDDNGAPMSAHLGIPQLEGMCTAEAALRTFVRKLPDDIGPSAAFMFRRSHYNRTGGFRNDFVYTMDIDLWAQLCMNGKFYGHSQPLATSRASTFNYSSRTSTVSKLVDIVRFNHSIGREFSNQVRKTDIVVGDLHVARRALKRLSARAAVLLD
jgi:glycosyltransferase involved in cell wall biosynthesis